MTTLSCVAFMYMTVPASVGFMYMTVPSCVGFMHMTVSPCVHLIFTDMSALSRLDGTVSRQNDRVLFRTRSFCFLSGIARGSAFSVALPGICLLCGITRSVAFRSGRELLFCGAVGRGGSPFSFGENRSRLSTTGRSGPVPTVSRSHVSTLPEVTICRRSQ